MQRIGFIGASGMMGHGMAKNLRAKGHPLALTVHRNAERVAESVLHRRSARFGSQLVLGLEVGIKPAVSQTRGVHHGVHPGGGNPPLAKQPGCHVENSPPVSRRLFTTHSHARLRKVSWYGP